MGPTAITLATALPETIPKRPPAIVLTFAPLPFKEPSIVLVILRKNSLAPLNSRKLPKIIKTKICFAAVPSIVPKIPDVSMVRILTTR